MATLDYVAPVLLVGDLDRSLAYYQHQLGFQIDFNYDVCFAVTDATTLASQLVDTGATIAVPLRKAAYGKEFYVKDPDGYILAFVESRRD